MSILTGYSRIPNGSDSFNSIPNGKDRTLEFLNALKSRQMQAQQRAVSFCDFDVVCVFYLACNLLNFAIYC